MDGPGPGAADRLERVLGAVEPIHARAESLDSTLAVIGDRLVVVEDRGVALDVPVDGIRRLQLDIERDRHGVLVIVPDQLTNLPQVLSIPPSEYDALARALVLIGRRLSSGLS